jgi:heme exporter protein D
MPHFETGKYAFFVWSAYGITALVFAILIVSSLNHSRRWKKKAQDLIGKPELARK